MTFVLGIVAALAAPLTMTLGFIVWDAHWTGSAFALNMFKCNLASLGFVILSLSTRGIDNIFPSDVFTVESVGFLVLSSTIGIIIGDWFWLEGLRFLGARRVIIMDSLKPFLAAVFGWAILDEQLKLAALGGIVLTVAGILLVSLEGKEEELGVESGINNNQEGQRIPSSDTNNHHSKSEDHSPSEAIVASETEVEVSTQSDMAPNETVTRSLGTGSFQQSSDEHDIVVDEKTAMEIVDDTREPTLSETIVPSPVSEEIIEPQTSKAAPRTSSFNKNTKTRLELQRGYLFSILNVLLDTYGSVLTKEYGRDMTTWEINLIRFGFAGLFTLACSLVLSFHASITGSKTNSTNETITNTTTSFARDDIKEDIENVGAAAAEANKHQTTPSDNNLWYKLPLDTMTKSSWIRVSCGVLFVTFLTPALSNYALFQIALALALTLGSVGPLYALPLTFLLQKDQKRPTVQAWLGASLAVAGIFVLSFWGQQS